MTEVLDELGQGSLPSTVRKRQVQEIADAKASGTSDRALEISKDIVTEPRAFKDAEEEAGVIHRIVKTRDDIRGVSRQSRRSTDVAEQQMLKAEMDRLESELSSLTKAYKIGGTKQAQAQALRGAFVDESFDVVSMKDALVKAKGKPLTEKEEQEVEAVAAKIDTVEERLSVEMESKKEEDVDAFIKTAKKTKKRMTKIKRADLVGKINELLEGCLYG